MSARRDHSAQTEEIDKQKATIASLQAERDKLVSEVEALKSRAPASETNTSPSSGWEAEKDSLVKSRDEALERLKAAEANLHKASNEIKSIKFQSDKFQTRIQDMMKAKATDAEKQAQIVAEAVEKAKSETNATSDPAATEELVKRHAEELKALSDRLKTEHEAALKAAVETASKPQPESSSSSTAHQQAAINAAISEHEKEAQARLEKEVTSAVERGRMEQAAKTKLKDSQLVRAQKRVKELESHIHEWRAAGINLPPPSTPAATIAPAAAPLTTAAPTPTAPRPAPSTPQATPKTTAPPTVAGPSQVKPIPIAPANPAASPTAASLPRRPAAPGAPAPTAPGSTVAARGGAGLRGRGATAARGLPGRGGVAGRGGAPLRQPPVKPATSVPLSGGVSIMGAAAKRPREENGAPAEDSLAKRLKPAEGSS
ncbi:hypothetical protein CPB83DRAFT_528677 [Crepidotus variabilis]|uniref:Uncharacterized protein n=1 Tax=Crepidotus variabilis TaxID=179855 RepID=A0A9P6EQ57_9AGAR|nr:hypothetical protein CPB83DRAFT_528677 [Crepidotus variabilis]